MSLGLPTPLRRLASLAAALLAVAGLLACVGAGTAQAAYTPNSALILCSTTDNGLDPSTGNCTTTVGLEQQEAAQADGFNVTTIDPTDWQSEAALGPGFFEQYQLIIFGDPADNCNSDTTGPGSLIASTASAWGQAVMSSGGNKVLIGADPTDHWVLGDEPAAPKLEAQSLAYAGSVSGATGVYLDMYCSWNSSAAGTGVAFLNNLSSQTPTGGTDLFTVEGYNANGNSGTGYCGPAVHIVASAGPTAGLTDSDLSQPYCSVQEVFNSWPADYTPLVLASSSYPSEYCAKDVTTADQVCGAPYMLLSGGGVRVSSQISLSPSSQTRGITSGTGASTTLTATVSSAGNPYPNATVSFTVTNGPDARETYTGTTDSSGHVTFTDANTYGIAGTDTITAVVTDAGGSREETVGSVSWQYSDNVSASGNDITGYSGEPLGSPTVSTFSDSHDTTTAGDWNASIDWGDGTTTTGQVSGSGGDYTVSGDHTYSTNGVYLVQVTITDPNLPTDTATTTATATITQAPLTVKAGSITPTEGQQFSGQIATLTGGSTQAAATDYTATVDWGDGQTSTGKITGSAANFSISASHTYAEAKTYTVTVKVVENANTSDKASDTTTATVSEAPITVTAHSFTTTLGRAYSGTVATFTDGDAVTPASDYTATIEWGDGHTDTGTITGGSGSFTVSGSHTYASVGSFPVTVSVQETDFRAPPSQDQGTATTSDAPLSADGKGSLTISSQAFSGVVATFTDGNPSATAGSFTAQITWGDGTSSQGTIAGGGGSYSVSASHTFSGQGPYAVKVTISDQNGGSTAASTTIAIPSSLSTTRLPHTFSARKLLCGVKKHTKCTGLKIQGIFPGSGNATWKLVLSKRGGKGKLVALGTVRRVITGSGTVAIVFKVASKHKAKKLYKMVTKKHLTNLRVQQTFTNSAGVHATTTTNVKLKR